MRLLTRLSALLKRDERTRVGRPLRTMVVEPERTIVVCLSVSWEPLAPDIKEPKTYVSTVNVLRTVDSRFLHPMFSAPMNDFPISELRIVEIWLHHNLQVSPHTERHMMHMSQVETFVKATVDLHHTRGNVHSGVRLDNLWEVRVNKLNLDTKAYWWGSPEQKNNDPNGAKINDTNWGERVWAHPELLAEERRIEDSED